MSHSHSHHHLTPPESLAAGRVQRRAMNLSLGIGFAMIAVKFSAYALTGSVAILSDAAESLVHVAAVGFAAWSLRFSQKPADSAHRFGHAKIAFFSAAMEGAMIFITALWIIYESITRWYRGIEIERLDLGIGLTAAAGAINAALGAYLIYCGKKHHSLILRANGTHVLTDCWTSIGVVGGLLLARWTGWLPWDPIFAIALALNILWSGFGLMREASRGLMDVADPEVTKVIEEVLREETEQRGINFHSLRHRDTGDGQWIELHLLFPKDTPVGEAHRSATEIEQAINAALDSSSHVTTHLEAREDHREIHGDQPQH